MHQQRAVPGARQNACLNGHRCLHLRSLTRPVPARSGVEAGAKKAKRDISSISEGGSKDASQRAERLQRLLDTINTQYGKGTISRLGSKPDETVPMIPTGCLSLDAALGGGYPCGRIIEIFGPESSGKTTLALHAIAEVQKKGGEACFIDAEHAFDKKYAAALGVDVSNLVMMQPMYGEQALEVADELARSGEIRLIVLDSVSALVPRAELEGEIGNIQVGSQARLMSSALRKLVGSCNKNGTAIIFLNQLRMKVGVMYGNPEVTSGGNALKYYSSVRIDIRKKESITGDSDDAGPIGIKVRAKVVKNKVGPPYRESTFDIMFGGGIDSLGSLLDGAEMAGVVTRRGAYYYFGDQKIAQGRNNAVTVLRENEELMNAVTEAVRTNLANIDLDAGPGEEGAEDDFDAGTFEEEAGVSGV
mmetsp:Transcript_14497/g.31514  ORF Transcript_14497/g.31514 Transcript_14497/m.31514 type:complete len:418 (-) Transcript_14497:2693-3946(-)